MTEETPGAWLARQYSEGIGLGDVIREYIDYREKPGSQRDNEWHFRQRELTTLMDYMIHLGETPVFDSKHRGTMRKWKTLNK